MTKTDLFTFIAKHKLGVLGSLSANGFPQSALVGIAGTRDLEIVFDTVNSSRKYRNLIENPAASFVIGWEDDLTLQYEGEAFEPKGDELTRYKREYFAIWPECRSHESWPGISYFVVRPKWIRYSDYNQAPPLIEEFSFLSEG